MLRIIKKVLPGVYSFYIQYLQKSLKEVLADIKLKKQIRQNSKKYFNVCSREDFINVIKNKKIISFDIFDTLLIRPFERPEDLLIFIELKYNVKNFSARRIEAERRARYVSPYEEITYDDIYNEIIPEFQKFKNIELECERKLLQINPLMKSNYEIAKSLGKEIILTSDMYFNKQILESFLNKNGITGFKNIFVSSEIRKTKRTGSLYKYILNELNISNDELIHFGDNFQSDYLLPESLGIESCIIPKVGEKAFSIKSNYWLYVFFKSKRNISRNIYKALISRRINDKEFSSYLYKLGYILGGPLVLSYLNFILENSKKNNIDKLLFVSRDGWILKEMYRKYLYPKFKIDFSYVYLSRMVGLFGTLDYCDDPEYLKKILLNYKNEGHVVQFSDDFAVNQAEFNNLFDKLKQFYKQKIDSLRKHIENEVGNSTNIATVDMTTEKFSSMYFASSIIKSKLKFGFFSYILNGGRKYKYISFGLKKNSGDDYKYIKLSELLVSSPENNIIDYNEGPVYKSDEDNSHALVYEEITKGIDQYIFDVMYVFDDDYGLACLESFDEWMELARTYITFLSKNERMNLKKIKHTDLFSRKNIIETAYQIFNS